MTFDRAAAVAAVEARVKEALAQQDASHDWAHVARVRALALRIAGEEGLPEASTLVVELGALLHDIADWKYKGDGAHEAACAEARVR